MATRTRGVGVLEPNLVSAQGEADVLEITHAKATELDGTTDMRPTHLALAALSSFAAGPKECVDHVVDPCEVGFVKYLSAIAMMKWSGITQRTCHARVNLSL